MSNGKNEGWKTHYKFKTREDRDENGIGYAVGVSEERVGLILLYSHPDKIVVALNEIKAVGRADEEILKSFTKILVLIFTIRS